MMKLGELRCTTFTHDEDYPQGRVWWYLPKRVTDTTIVCQNASEDLPVLKSYGSIRISKQFPDQVAAVDVIRVSPQHDEFTLKPRYRTIKEIFDSD